MIEKHQLNVSLENKETASLNGKIQFLNSGDALYFLNDVVWNYKLKM